MRIAIGSGVVQWVARKVGDGNSFGGAQGIGLQDFVDGDWRFIAGAAYSDYNGPNVIAHIAAEAPLTRKFVWTIFDYPFNKLKVNRITCTIGEKNLASIRLCEHFGFARETALRNAHPDGDMLVYVMFKEDCKWLSLGRPKHYALAA